MRSLIAAIAVCLAGCSADPEPVSVGPRLEARLVATWPVAAPAREATFSRDGRLLATSDASGLITLCDTRSWKPLEQLHHPGGATTVVFSGDGSHLYSAGYDGAVRDWDVARKTVSRTFSGASGTIWTMDVSPDGKTLAVGGEDSLIRLWALERDSPATVLRGHARNIWRVRFSPNGKTLASGSFDASARLWDASTGRPLHILKGHTEAIVGLDFSPDGKLLVTGGDDSTIRYWRASDGAPVRTIDAGKHVDAVTFTPDGKWIASGGHARGAIGTLWHQATGGGAEGDSVRLWRTADGALTAVLRHPDDVISLTVSPDGNWLVTSGEDNRFRLWRLRPGTS